MSTVTSSTPFAAVAPPAPVGRGARQGVAAMAPIALGYVPFALVVGAAVAEHGAGLAGWAGSWLIFGGSAHLTAIQLLDTSGAVVAIVSAVLVNARLVAYSASLGRRWQHQPRWFRALGAALVIDPTWALAHDARPATAREQRSFFLAAALTLGVIWSAGVAVGATVGLRVESGALEVAAPLSLLALVGPRLARRDERFPLVVAGVVALLFVGAPAGLGTVGAVLAAVVAGELVTASTRSRP
jgi:predicted branched-subunit amino acid permease